MKPISGKATAPESCSACCRGRSSFSAVNMSGFSSPMKEAGRSGDHAVAICCFGCRRLVRRERSPGSSSTEEKENCSVIHPGASNVRRGFEAGLYTPAKVYSRRDFYRRPPGECPIVGTTYRADQYCSVFLWDCCLRGVTGRSKWQRGAGVWKMTSGSERDRQPHFLVRFARQNLWNSLDRRLGAVPSHQSNSCGYLGRSAGDKPPIAFDEQANVFGWTAATFHLRQQSAKATPEEHHLRNLRGSASRSPEPELRSLRGCSLKPHYPSDFRDEADACGSRKGASAVEGQGPEICSKLSTVLPFTDGRKRVVDVMSKEALQAASLSGGAEGSLLLSLFLKYICVLLENLSAFVLILKAFGSAHDGQQVTEAVQLTLLGIVEIVLLALQEPERGRSCGFPAGSAGLHRPHLRGGPEQSLVDTIEGAFHYNPVSRKLYDNIEKVTTKRDVLPDGRDEHGISLKEGHVRGEIIEGDLERNKDQIREDIKPHLLQELHVLQAEVNRQRNELNAKKKQLLNAVTGRHTLLSFAMRSKSLANEYQRRRRLLSLLEIQIRRTALLRGNRKRCPCLFHQEIARPETNVTVGLNGRFQLGKSSWRPRAVGLDTQPVGHANQVFHSNLRTPQVSFRSMYEQAASCGASVKNYQDTSCERAGLSNKSASLPALGKNSKHLSLPSSSLTSQRPASTSPLPRSPRRVSVPLEETAGLPAHSSRSGQAKSSDTVPDSKEDGTELHSLKNEVDDIVEKYMERYTEDGLPVDFKSFFDVRHIGGEAIMPPLNAAADKKHGWKQNRMLFFVERLTSLVVDGEPGEEQATALAEPVVALVEQTKVEQCDLKIHSFAERLRRLVMLSHSSTDSKALEAEARNLLPVAYRTSRALTTDTGSLPVEETVLNEKSSASTHAGSLQTSASDLPCSLVSSPAGGSEDPLSCSSLRSRGTDAWASWLTDGRRVKECIGEGGSAPRTAPAPLPVLRSAFDRGPNTHSQKCTAGRENSFTSDDQRLETNTDSVLLGKSPAENVMAVDSISNEGPTTAFAAAYDVYPPPTEHSLNISWLPTFSVIESERPAKQSSAVAAVLLLPAAASQQQREVLAEKLKSVSRVGVASIAEGGATECQGKGCSIVSSDVVQWVTCSVGLVNGVGCAFSATGLSYKSAGTTRVASLPTDLSVCSAEIRVRSPPIHANGTTCDKELRSRIPGSAAGKLVTQGLLESTKMGNTLCEVSEARQGFSKVSCGGGTEASGEKSSPMVVGVRNISVNSKTGGFFCKPEQPDSGSAMQSVVGELSEPGRTVAPRMKQGFNNASMCSSFLGHKMVLMDGGGADDTGFTQHCETRAVLEAPGGFPSGSAHERNSAREPLSPENGPEVQFEDKDADEVFNIWTGSIVISEAAQICPEKAPGLDTTVVAHEAKETDPSALGQVPAAGKPVQRDCFDPDADCNIRGNDSVCSVPPNDECAADKTRKKTRSPETVRNEEESVVSKNGELQKSILSETGGKTKEKKKLPIKRRKAKTMYGHPPSGANDSRANRRDGPPTPESTYSRKANSSSSEKMQGRAVDAKSGAWNAQKEARGRGKGMLSEKKTPKKSKLSSSRNFSSLDKRHGRARSPNREK